MSGRYGRGRAPPRGDRYYQDKRSHYEDRASSQRSHHDDRPSYDERPSRRGGRDSSRGSRREETPPRRRRERRGSSTHHHNSHHSHGGDANAQINQIIRKLERDDRRERTRLAVQIQDFAQDPANRQVLEAQCVVLLNLLDPMIEDAVERENDYNLPRTIAAIGLGLGSKCNELINWLTNRLMSANANNTPQVTGFLLNITKHLSDKKGSLSTGVLPLIDTLIQLLERFAHPQMIIILLDALVPLTQAYSRFFTPHFTNIIDVLIGWHIELDTNVELQKSITKAFMAFKPFWMSDISYPLSLIMQFVDDAQKQQYEVCNSAAVDKEAVKQFVSLIRVFTALLSALEEVTSASPNSNVPDFLSKLVNQIIDSSSQLLCAHASYEVVSVIANSTDIITKCLPSHFGLICDQLVCFLIDCISPLDSTPAPESVILDCLHAILHITDSDSSWLGANILTSMLAPTSPLVSLRNSKNEQILAVLFKIYQSLLQLHNFKLLDIVYQFIVQDLHIAIERLLKCVEDKTDLKDAEILASANLALLTEMAGSKTHGFSTWALNPTIFDLVTSVHSPHNWILAKHCPSVHYAILNVLHAECKRHGYFLPGAGTSEVVQLQPHNTSQQLCRVLKLLSLLLPHPSLSFDSRYFCLLWVKRLVEIMKKAGECSESMKFCHSELQDLSLALVRIADDPERDIRLEVAGCLRLLLLAQLLTHDTQIHCLAVSVLHMGDVDGATRGAFVGVLEALAPQLLLGYEIDRLNMDKYTMRPLLHSRHLLQYNTEASLVSSNQFTILMRLILLNQIPGKFIHDDWLERLFYTCNTAQHQKFTFINGLTSPCDSSLWCWFMWHMSLYAVNSRLKTPLGKATETFECIEGILHELLEDGTITEDTNARGIISGIGSQCYVSLLRSNLLLHFINNLEKLIYNAYEGTVHSIQGCNKAVKNFFVLNRSTCEEWFSRIRPAIAEVCINSGMSAESWRHALHIQPSTSAMLLSVRAALNMHAPGYIRGLKSVYSEHSGLLHGAELQASGRYEEASEVYKATIETVSSSDEKQFIALQALECYLALNDWDETLSWSQIHSNEIYTDKTPYDKNYLHALHAFDLGDFGATARHLEGVPGANINSITEELSRKGGVRVNHLTLELDVPALADPAKLLYLSQLQLLRVCGLFHNGGDIPLSGMDLRSDTGSYSDDMDRPESALEKGPEFIFRKLLRQASSLVEVGVRIAGIDLPVMMPGRTAVQLQCVSALHQLLLCDTVKAPTGVPLNLTNEEIHIDPSVHEVGSWMYLHRYAHHLYQYFEPVHENSKNMLTSPMVLNLGVSVAKLARKQGNVRLAQRLLINELTWHFSGVHPSRPPLPNNIVYISDNTAQEGPDMVLRSTLHSTLSKSLAQYIPVDLLPLHSQSAKVLYQCGSQSEAIEALSAAVLYRQRNPNTLRNNRDNEGAMKCVLTLAKWLSQDSTLGLMALSQGPCLHSLLEIEERATANSAIRLRDGVAVSEVEYLEGRLLRYVAEEASDMANAWHALGTWAYDISKKSLDQIQLARVETMLPEEKLVVEELAGNHCDAVWNLILGAVTRQSSEGLDERITNTAPDLSKDIVKQLCEVFQRVYDRLYYNYRIAVKSYCRYLHLSAGERDCTTRVDRVDKTTHRELQTTLRLLKLMTSHDTSLHDLVEDISRTPALQWYKVTPQLLSRIGHSNPAVRSALLTILCSVARQYPHRLVYNCVEKCSPSSLVDSEQNKSDLADMIEGIDLEDDEEVCNGDIEPDKNPENEHSDLFDSGYQTIYNTLLQHSQDIVSDVQIIVHELRRINLLRAELWAGVLGHRYTDITRKFNQLASEIKRVNSNLTLSNEEKHNIASAKQQALLKPLVVMLKRVIKITNQAGETKYELDFQNKFGDKINKAMEHLETCVDLKNPTRCWSKFEELHHELQDYIKSNLMHSLHDISPRLAQLTRLSTPLPGTHQDYRASGHVTIESFHQEVHVLPTKTKPKKIGILGSDGRKYTYLFKGLEDLRLDERVMQLLSVCNVMFSSSGCGQYSVTQYSVTPLGPRSGLIQWVSSGSPLFSLYKRWQQRETLKNNPDQPPAVLNCSEIFHSKVHAVMSKLNLNEKLPRSEWPPEVLLEVLKQLTSETPSDLLSKELWCSSTSPTHWWNTVQRFTHSSAAMSIIGFVIGLGDRHLDNILVDFQKGDIVHIDYNVCFEKGRGLRVPERVPCRLTSNITQAFGPAGVEGTFRIACEKIMSVLRSNREVILSLLDAFVYDPLIEWTSANDEGVFAEVVKDANSASRKELEMNSLYSLLSCRIVEMNVPLKNNKLAFIGAMDATSKSLHTFSEVLAKFSPQEIATSNIIARQRLLCDVKGDPEHSLWQLQERYEAQAAHNSSHAALNGELTTAADRYKTQQNKFRAILEFIEGNVLDTLITRLTSMSQDTSTSPSYLPALDFLTTSGQTELVSQTEQIDADINSSLVARRNATITAVRALKPYGSIVSFFQRHFVNQHPGSFWADWLERVTLQPSALHCDDICAQCEIAALKIRTVPSENSHKIEEHIQEHSNSLKIRLHNCIEQQSKIPGTPDLAALETVLLEEDSVSVTCAIASSLIEITETWVTMETSVHESSANLGSLNTVTGQWFLDEFVSSSKLAAAQVEVLLKLNKDAQCDKVQLAVNQNVTFIEDLSQVYNTYCTIVLHETLKTLHSGNQHVLSSLYEYIQILETALQDGLSEDAAEVYAAIRGSETSGDIRDKITEISESVKHYQERITTEFHTNDQTKSNYKGCLLIMCLESLLTKTVESVLVLADAHRAVLHVVDQKHPHFEEVGKSRELRYLDLNKWENSELYGLLYVTLLQAINAYLQRCFLHVQLFDRTSESGMGRQDTEELVWSSTDYLLDPIKQFLGMVLRIGGIGYYNSLLSHVTYSTISAHLESTDTELTRLSQLQFPSPKSSSVDALNGWKTGWCIVDTARRLSTQIRSIKSSLQRCQLELIAFQWLHEDSETSSGTGSGTSTSPRSAFISDLSAKLDVLRDLESTIDEKQESYEAVENKIRQRLTWAAGANPSTREVLERFEGAASTRKSALNSENKYTSDVIEMCVSVIDLEKQRLVTEERQEEHEALLTLLRKFAESTGIVEEYSKELAESTHLIHTLAAPEKGMSPEWIEQELKSCSKQLSASVGKQKQIQTEVKKSADLLLADVEKTKEQAALFVKLVGEIAENLSSLAQKETGSTHGARTLLKSHQKLVTDLKLVLAGIKECAGKCRKEQCDSLNVELWVTKTPELIADLINIRSLIEYIFSQLDSYAGGAQTIAQPPSLFNITPSTKTKTRLLKSPEKNQYAMNVLKRVQSKLEGRDGGVVLSVPDQVTSVINSATSQHNLSLMYEGWTPWV